MTFDADRLLQDTVVIGDVSRVKQVILNFLSNAYKFTNFGGKVCVSVKEIHRTDESVTIRTSVIDTGIGMTEANQARIFKPWSQVQSHENANNSTAVRNNLEKYVLFFFSLREYPFD
jgi:signal transduction histidine kinase